MIACGKRWDSGVVRRNNFDFEDRTLAACVDLRISNRVQNVYDSAQHPEVGLGHIDNCGHCGRSLVWGWTKDTAGSETSQFQSSKPLCNMNKY